MASNYIQPGRTVTLTAPYQVAAGAGALVGSLFGVATKATANGARGEFITTEAHALAKATGQAWTEGAKLYWDNTAKNVTTTSSANTLIGCALAAAATGDVTGTVRLNGTVV